jgi:hypothetical protein
MFVQTTVEYGYIFFSEHLLVEASQVPPAFSQSAALVAFVTSPAKAGPVKASAKANANMEMSAFMTFPPLRLCTGAGKNPAGWLFVPLARVGPGAEADTPLGLP